MLEFQYPYLYTRKKEAFRNASGFSCQNLFIRVISSKISLFTEQGIEPDMSWMTFSDIGIRNLQNVRFQELFTENNNQSHVSLKPFRAKQQY